MSKVFGLSTRNRAEYRFIIWLQHSGGNGFPSDIEKENGYGYFIPDSSRAGKGYPGR